MDAANVGDPVCEHEEAPPQEWVWLPRVANQVTSRHSWCQRCGTVKYAGPRRAHDLGGLANRLAVLYEVMEANGVRVADVQRRLVMRRFAKEGVDDRFGLGRDQQDECVVRIVSQQTGASPEALGGFLHAC